MTRLDENHKATFLHDAAVVDTIAARCKEVESGGVNVDHILTCTPLPAVASEVLARQAEGRSVSVVHAGIGDGGSSLTESSEPEGVSASVGWTLAVLKSSVPGIVQVIPPHPRRRAAISPPRGGGEVYAVADTQSSGDKPAHTSPPNSVGGGSPRGSARGG